MAAGGVAAGDEPEQIELFGSVYGQVLRTQELYREVATQSGSAERVIAPVSNRGDAIGLLELTLPARSDGATLQTIRESAHILAYIVIANQRFTDLYTWGKRTTRLTLPAEIQHQLLPPSLTCEASEFAVSGALEPSEAISGDTFDYALDRENLHLSVTDPMGHDVNAARLATVLMAALRGARRSGADLGEQARQADQALAEHGGGAFATGQLLRIRLVRRRLRPRFAEIAT